MVCSIRGDVTSTNMQRAKAFKIKTHKPAGSIELRATPKLKKIRTIPSLRLPYCATRGIALIRVSIVACVTAM